MHVGDIVPTGKTFVLAFQATEDLDFSYLRMMRLLDCDVVFVLVCTVYYHQATSLRFSTETNQFGHLERFPIRIVSQCVWCRAKHISIILPTLPPK